MIPRIIEDAGLFSRPAESIPSIGTQRETELNDKFDIHSLIFWHLCGRSFLIYILKFKQLDKLE